MTNVYFFSRHQAQQQMISDVGGKITGQFFGTISEIAKDRNTGNITFLETTIDENGKEKKQQGAIEADAILIVVAPLPIQVQWLSVGVKALLTPQNNREIDESGRVTFNYAGLLHVKEIKIVSEQWSGNAVSLEQKTKERSVLS